jgi:hypothetical protein
MPALLLVLVLLLAGCVPGRAAPDGVPTADAPFTLTALDVGQPTFPFRCIAAFQGGCLRNCSGPREALRAQEGREPPRLVGSRVLGGSEAASEEEPYHQAGPAQFG